MSLLIVTSTWVDQFLKAICYTLVHSLWLGLLLAVAGGVIVMRTRKTKPARRYNWLLGALLSFTFTITLTFIKQFSQIQQTETRPAPVSSRLPVVSGNAEVSLLTSARTGIDELNDGLSAWLDSHHKDIVLLWLVLIFLKSIQLAAGLRGIHWLRRVKLAIADRYWINRMEQLASRLGIRKTIQLLESGLAQTPMVIGHLKPILLIPVGFLSSLPPEEIEAILVHELAHIRRADYLVNLLQNLLEIIFFFNPAVLWISGLIRKEREHCCDELAVVLTGSKKSYINALVACEERNSMAPAYALSFAGQRNQLVDRVRRMVTNRNPSLNLFEKIGLALCLVLTGLYLLARVEKQPIQRFAHVVGLAFTPPRPDPRQQHELSRQTNLLTTQTTLRKQQTRKIMENSPANDTTKLPPRPKQKPRLLQSLHSLQPLQSWQPLQPLASIPDRPPVLSAAEHPSGTPSTDPSISYLPHHPQLFKKKAKYSMPDLPGELMNAHIIEDRSNVDCMINNEELVVNGIRQPEGLHQQLLKKFMKTPDSKINLIYNNHTNKKG